MRDRSADTDPRFTARLDRSPRIAWTAAGIVARTSASCVRRWNVEIDAHEDHAVAPDTLAFALAPDGAVWTTDGFRVRAPDGREVTLLEIVNPWGERRVIERCCFNDDASVVGATWSIDGVGWAPYDAMALFDARTGVRIPAEFESPDEFVDAEMVFSGELVLFAYRTVWHASPYGSAGGPGRGFCVRSIRSGTLIGLDSDFGMGDADDTSPRIYALDRSGSFVVSAGTYRGEHSASRFVVARSAWDLDARLEGFVAVPGTVAVDRRGGFVAACRGLAVRDSAAVETMTIAADEPMGVALSPDETRVAWIERSGAIRVAELRAARAPPSP